MTGPWIAAWVATVCLSIVTAALLLGLLRRLTSLLQSVEGQLRSGAALGGVPVGMKVPTFDMQDGSGSIRRSSDVLVGPAVLLFVSHDCSPCVELLRDLEGHAEGPGRAQLLVIGQRDAHLTRTSLPRDAFADVNAFARLNVVVTPFAMAIDSAGVVAARTVPNTLESLRQLELAIREEVIHVEGGAGSLTTSPPGGRQG
jgi:hypothetical protein